ncbi:hypothetical protein DL93DRAFT_245169 [Clavulina sp. PMI_390]|nr:hypothetical protein DL93DRAFT_245169 [Clavulina sp. PMI_390]
MRVSRGWVAGMVALMWLGAWIPLVAATVIPASPGVAERDGGLAIDRWADDRPLLRRDTTTSQTTVPSSTPTTSYSFPTFPTPTSTHSSTSSSKTSHTIKTAIALTFLASGLFLFFIAYFCYLDEVKRKRRAQAANQSTDAGTVSTGGESIAMGVPPGKWRWG